MFRLFYILISLLSVILSIPAYAADTSFAVTTNSFLDQGTLPTLYTCDGKDVSPELDWSNTPAKTQAFAIIMNDPDAPNGNWYHWVVYNLPKDSKQILEGAPVPAGASMGKNSWDKLQYNGPCPPMGGPAHHYVFTVYALDSKLTLPAGADGKAVEDALKSHVVQKAVITGVYSRWAVALPKGSGMSSK